MSASETEGKTRPAVGQVEEAAGEKHPTLAEMRSRIREVAGQAQETVGEAVGTVREFTVHQPIMAVLLAAGVGLIAGMLIARR